jgi:peptidoglycan/LPS O-acetylase OafA/YrhL
MNELKGRRLSGSTSVFLDCLRILAALFVVIYHAFQQWGVTYLNITSYLENFAHSAVVLFFVLSGYLIGYTATNNNRGIRQYAAARLSRLYSVVIPTLVLMAIVEIMVNYFDPGLAAHYSKGSVLIRYGLCFTFCNEIGLFSAAPPINSPLWSLSYEFWYYLIFGVAYYLKSGWKSVMLVAIACLIAGPKILLLLPIWLFGFFAYRLTKPTRPVYESWLVVIVLFAAAGLFTIYGPAAPYILGSKPLYFASQFLKDWLLGILFSVAIWYLPTQQNVAKNAWVKPLRTIADLSFSLYVLHYPLLILWRAIFGWQVNNILQPLQAAFFASLVALAIGLLLEAQRNKWVNFFTWATSRHKAPVITPIK